MTVSAPLSPDAPHSPADSAPPGASLDLQAPSLYRRLSAFVYEGVLLFGVLMLSAWLYSGLTQLKDPSRGVTGLQLFMLVVLAIYFTWFWSRGGQTVAMKAWHIRLVDRHGQPVGQWRALCRFALAWLWFVPALATVYVSGQHGGGILTVALLAGVITYAGLSRLHPQRQFWHDVVCGTRLITWRPALPAKAGKASKAG